MPKIHHRDLDEDSVQKATNRQVKSRPLIHKMIVYVVLILSIACIGFVFLFEVPFHILIMSSTNKSIDPLVQKQDIKANKSSIKFNNIPGNDGHWPIVGRNEMTDADNTMRDCNMLDEVLLGERRARLAALKYGQFTEDQKIFWGRIHSAWNAVDLWILPIDNHELDFMYVLSMMKHIVGKATQELQEEGYELLHDLFLEEQRSQNQSDTSMDWMYALGNFTANIKTISYTPALAVMTFNVLAEGFNLYYQKIEIEYSEDDLNKFAFGEFVYRGKNPEKLYVRNVRHILNAIVRLYLRIDNPSALNTMCGDRKLKKESKKPERKLFNYIEESLKHSNNWYASPAAAPAIKRKRSWTFKSDSMEDPNLITSKRFQSSLEMFFDKMEILSSHIDRLHERYMTLNELNDDYISQEFSMESDFTDDEKI